MGYLAMEEKKAKIDTLFYGITAGIILPIIGFFISYPIKTRSRPIAFEDYLELAFKQNPEQTDILIFCLIPNMFMFYFSNFRYQWNEFTKGLVGATVVGLLGLIFLTY